MTHPQPNPPEKVESLVERLRETTAHMANSCSAPMSLWQEHSTAVLHAASRIEALEAQVAGMGEALEPFDDFADNVDDVGWASDIHKERISYWFGPSDFRKARLAAHLAAAKEPS